MSAPPLTPGVYMIRFIPKDAHPPFIGGEYASSKNGVGHPVGTEAENPSVVERLRWQVDILKHEPNFVLYGIKLFPPLLPPILWTHKTPFPGGPVMLEFSPPQSDAEWLIQRDRDNVYNIMALSPPGVGWCVDRDPESGDLFVKPVPIGDYLARWEFTRAWPLEE